MASAACGMLIEPDLIASSWVWKSEGMNRSVSIWYMVAGLLEYVATVVLIVRLEAVRLYLPLAIANEYILVDLGRFLGRCTHTRCENPSAFIEASYVIDNRQWVSDQILQQGYGSLVIVSVHALASRGKRSGGSHVASM